MSFINGLHFNNICGDIYSGITAGVVALPLALAFGVSPGVGRVAGLCGAIFVGARPDTGHRHADQARRYTTAYRSSHLRNAQGSP